MPKVRRQNLPPALFQHLLDLAPDHVNGRVALGVAFAATGQVAEAKAAFQQAVELDPGNQYAVRSLGALAARAGEDADAIMLPLADVSEQAGGLIRGLALAKPVGDELILLPVIERGEVEEPGGRYAAQDA